MKSGSREALNLSSGRSWSLNFVSKNVCNLNNNNKCIKEINLEKWYKNFEKNINGLSAMVASLLLARSI